MKVFKPFEYDDPRLGMNPTCKKCQRIHMGSCENAEVLTPERAIQIAKAIINWGEKEYK